MKELLGSSLILNTHTRMLARVSDGKSVLLGVSACECLQKLYHNRGKIVSQSDLLDAGWRRSGIEVTSSSLRGVIGQIRRAFLSLQVSKDYLVVSVPKAGYRLVVNFPESIDVEENGSEQAALNKSIAVSKTTESPSSADEGITASQPELPNQDLAVSPVQSLVGSAFISGVVAVAALLGGGLSFFAGSLFENVATHISYMPYEQHNVSLPQGVHLFVNPGGDSSPEVISETLNLMKKYAEEALSASPYLYISARGKTDFMGVFACKKPIGEQRSDCESYVFNTHP